MNLRAVVAAALLLGSASLLRAQNAGHDLWLRYPPVSGELRTEYRAAIGRLVIADESPTMRAARDELTRGVAGLTGAPLPVERDVRQRRHARRGHAR